MKNKVRPIDANALAKRIREYMDNFPYAGTRLATCRVVLSMLGDEGQTPTLTDHFPDLTNMIPLTMDQLRKMEGQPYWHVGLQKDSPKPHWKILDPFVAKRPEDYGYAKSWLAYDYPLSHIDRELWECPLCSRYEVISFKAWKKPEQVIGGPFAQGGAMFCPHCGKPRTPEAWAELKNRLGFGHMLNWVSVEERLPRDGQSVLVWCSSRMLTKHVSFSTFYKGKWSRRVKEVTHWMPLPEPPKEK